MAFTGTTTEFLSLKKIDFTKVMDGMKFNGQNWPKFYEIFIRNIQSHVPKKLLTTRFFTGSKYSGYQRIDNMATIVANPTADDLYRGQFNILYMKQLWRKLVLQTFNKIHQDAYFEIEEHFTCIFPSDWHNGHRTLPDMSNDGTTWPQGGVFQTYKRLPSGRHSAENYRAAIKLLGRPTSYEDFFNKLEQVYDSYKEGQ
ncbi:29665_t:CDS:2, partial [Racocetra persica]